MRTSIFLLMMVAFTACSSSSPLTVNPDRGNTTTGGTGSAEITEGTAKEGMNTTQTGVKGDSTRMRKDSVQFRP